jgi:hypothetical protein
MFGEEFPPGFDSLGELVGFQLFAGVTIHEEPLETCDLSHSVSGSAWMPELLG